MSTNAHIKLSDREKAIIEELSHPEYTVEWIEEWINRNDNVFVNAIAALQAMGAKGFYEAVKSIADIFEELDEYRAAGFTPAEIKLILNPPEKIYIIENSTDEKSVIETLYPETETTISLAAESTYWNCTDDYGDYREVEIRGLNGDYFIDEAAAAARLEEMKREGGNHGKSE